jgi:hypothetical protein
MPTPDITTPSCVVAEKGILSCILNEGNCEGGTEEWMLDQLHVPDFHDLTNRGICEALLGLQKEGKPLNILQLLNSLNGKADPDYARLLLLESPSPLQFPIYLKDLKDAAIRRRIYLVGQTAQNLATKPDLSPNVVYAELQEEFQKAALGSLSGSGLPPIEEFEEFTALDIPKPPELIKDLLHQGSKMLISGGSKAHKTWALIDMAVSVHTGTPLWGLQTTQANVLYINLELDRYFAQYRCKEIRRAKNIPNAKGLRIWNLRSYSCDISELRKRLMPEILKGDYGLIVFDPIYKVYGGRDENSVSDVAEIMNELEQIINATGSALVYATHQTKGIQSGKESIDRISGSGAFARDVDTGLILTAHDEEGCYTAEAPILRNFKPFEPFVLRWEFPLMVRDDELDPKHLKEKKNPNSGKPCTIEQVMAHVPLHEPIDKHLLVEKVKGMGIGVNRARDLIHLAVSKKQLFPHSVKRSGTNDLQQIARYPQKQQGDLHDSHDLHA